MERRLSWYSNITCPSELLDRVGCSYKKPTLVLYSPIYNIGKIANSFDCFTGGGWAGGFRAEWNKIQHKIISSKCSHCQGCLVLLANSCCGCFRDNSSI